MKVSSVIQRVRCWLERFNRPTAKQRLLTNLKRIRRRDPKTLDTGICNLVMAGESPAMSKEIQLLLRGLFRRWPEFSGSIEFPIPAPPDILSSWMYKHEGAHGNAYFHFEGNKKWHRSNSYGAARWRMLDFLIQEMEKELEDA